MNRDPVLDARGVSKVFEEGPSRVEVLKAVDLQVAPGERVAIVGSSGSGKSTLLHILGGLDKPSAGSIEVAGENLASMKEAARCAHRNRSIGFIYQFHHLLAEFSAAENVAMPLLIRGVRPRSALQEARELLARVGLEARVEHKPPEMSGGERQRAAIARALIGRPECVLADEPTGNLDRANAQAAFDLMNELHVEEGTSLIMVTHDEGLAARMDRRLALVDGALSS